MRFTLKALALGATCGILCPPTANAQAPVRAESPWAVELRPAIAAMPAAGASSWSERFARTEPAHPAAPAPVQKDKETGLTLMIVGGSALVAGLIIGDTGGTILAVGGIGVGAYGLYLYMD